MVQSLQRSKADVSSSSAAGPGDLPATLRAASPFAVAPGPAPRASSPGASTPGIVGGTALSPSLGPVAAAAPGMGLSHSVGALLPATGPDSTNQTPSGLAKCDTLGA